jgi:hypothetical protein
MIITQKKQTIIESHNFDSVKCTIDAEDMRYVASLLRNNYSNTRLAVVREISANALDANTEAGSDRRIEISVPTQMHPNFSVRDFGGGLSEEDIFGLYSKYGKSTKRQSNSYIGAFGIGKFAPLSYGDSFSCVSFHNGMKTTYNVFVNDDDDTKIARIGDPEPSNEPTGLKIEVAVADNEVSEFQDIVKGFFRFFSDSEMPKFLGVEPDFVASPKVNLSDDENSWFFLESDRSHYYRSNSNVLMGRVAYPIDSNSIKTENFISNESVKIVVDNLLRDANFYFRIPLGAVKLHHSRESLEYNKSTQKEICKVLVKIADQIKVIAVAKLADSTCLYMAKRNYATILNSLPHGISQVMKNSFEWQSIEITSPQWSRDHEMQDDLVITRMEKSLDKDSRNGFRVSSQKTTRVVAEKNVVFMIQDMDSSHGNNLRARTLFNDDEELKAIYVIHPRNQDAKDYMDNSWAFNLVNEKFLFNSSDVEKEKIARNNVSGTKSRATIPVFKMQFDRSYTYRNADYWQDVKNPINSLEMDSVDGKYKGKMVYAPIKNFKIDDAEFTLESVHATIKVIRAKLDDVKDDEGNKLPQIELFGVRTKDTSKLDKDLWISFTDVYIDFSKTHLRKNKAQSLSAYKKKIHTISGFEIDSSFDNLLNKTSCLDFLPLSHPIRVLCDNYQVLSKDISRLDIRCVNLLIDKEPKWVESFFDYTFNVDVARKNHDHVKKTYPLLEIISYSICSWGTLEDDRRFGNVKNKIRDYISLCDRGEGE